MARKTSVREKLEGMIDALSKLQEKNPEFKDSLAHSIKDARNEFTRVSYAEVAEILVDLEEVNGPALSPFDNQTQELSDNLFDAMTREREDRKFKRAEAEREAALAAQKPPKT